MGNVGAGTRDCGDCVWLTSDPDVVTARERGRALAEALGFSAARSGLRRDDDLGTRDQHVDLRAVGRNPAGDRQRCRHRPDCALLRVTGDPAWTVSDSRRCSGSPTMSRSTLAPDEAPSSPSPNGSTPRSIRQRRPDLVEPPGRGEALDSPRASGDHAHLRRPVRPSKSRRC